MSERVPLRGRKAFSMVEVALSLGIISFALVAIFGLLSVGINASRDNDADTRIGFIMQDVAARVRAETANVDLIADATQMDLTWSADYGGRLSYTVLGNTTLPNDATGQPEASATAYYSAEGMLVKQSTSTAPTPNYYKASIYIQPLDPYPSPMSVAVGGPYPFLAVTIKIGWPTDQTVNGSVIGATNSARAICTFYLLRP